MHEGEQAQGQATKNARVFDEYKNDGNDTTSYKVLDIGVGANCIYPIIGAKLFNWQMVGADIHNDAVASAKKIVAATKGLKNNIEIACFTLLLNIF